MAKQYYKPQPKPEIKEEPIVEPKVERALIPLIAEPLAKKLFLGFAAILLLLMAIVSHQYGITGDENVHRLYGHDIINFYSTLGKDDVAARSDEKDSIMINYGGFYDGTATLLAKSLPFISEWNVRHFWNSIFGFVAMLCAGFVAVEIAGWQAGLLTLLFMALSPRFFGESMNNPKDITMATGYVLAYVFIIKFLKQLPRPGWKTALGLGISIGVAMGVRVGGLLLIPYLYLFYGLAMLTLLGWKELFDFSKFGENIWPSLGFVILASVMGYGLSLIFWPYGLVSPINHPLEALKVAEKFPIQIRILFDSKSIMSSEVPWNYIPQWLFITTPLFGLVGLVLSFALIPSMVRKGAVLFLVFLYFTLLFPICYIIYKKSSLYDSMRHFFFVYPSIIILAGLGFDYLLKVFPKSMKYATAAIVIILMFLPARFMFANHPNECVYFNELEGGIKGAYGNYETDYYMNSVKQCADWLKEHENLKRSDGRKTAIFSNAVTPAGFYFRPDSAFVAVGYASYRRRCEKDADYEIMYCRFIDRGLLINGAFPPEQTVYTVYADGVPLSCVIKNDDKDDYLGIEKMGNGDYEGAVKMFEPYAAKYPKNDVVLADLGLCYLNTQRFDDAIRVLSQSLSLNNESVDASYWLGIAHFYKHDYSNAANILLYVITENPYYTPAYHILSDCMARLGNQDDAEKYASIYKQLGGGR